MELRRRGSWALPPAVSWVPICHQSAINVPLSSLLSPFTHPSPFAFQFTTHGAPQRGLGILNLPGQPEGPCCLLGNSPFSHSISHSYSFPHPVSSNSTEPAKHFNAANQASHSPPDLRSVLPASKIAAFLSPPRIDHPAPA